MRYLIVGDVHGCITELENLLSDFAPQDSDVIISLGDLIHKGPNQDACLKLIREHSKFFVMGNHEEKQLRWEYQEDVFVETGRPNQVKAKDYVRLGHASRSWLTDNAKLFYQIKTPKEDFLIVHGGILPKLRALPGVNDVKQFTGRDKKFYFSMLRTRYVTPKGDMVSLGDETEYDKYWAEVYDGRFGTVVSGHQPWLGTKDVFDGPGAFNYAIGLDLGCVYGGSLAGLVIDSDGNKSSIIVPAKYTYKDPRNSKD